MTLNSQSASATQAVGYIGKDVTASGVKSELTAGKASWSFNVAQAAPNTTVTVKDADGNVVFTHEGALAAGTGEFQWDGTTSDGGKRSSGTFSLTIDARDGNGKTVTASTEATGKVTGVDLTGDEPVLLVGTRRLSLSSVTSVRATAS
jgi:flagellar basal-body rod modification protein FlgD